MQNSNTLQLSETDVESKTISFLRFPLIVGVVFIHSRFEDVIFNGVNLMENENFFIYENISYLFSDIFSSIAVPLFFFFSGFLFFYKTEKFTPHIYFQKLKKRFKTLLIPYIIWNLITVLLYFIQQTFLSDLSSGNNKFVSEYTGSDWFLVFWDMDKVNPISFTSNGLPICHQFWFIRDLMIVILVSPIVYFYIKKFRIYSVVLLGVLWFFGYWFDIVGLSIICIFFFSFGAYFSIHKMNFVKKIQPLLSLSFVLYFIFSTIILIFKEEKMTIYLSNLNILIGILLAISLSSYFIEKGQWKSNEFLTKSSFFIYAYHGLFPLLIIKSLFHILQPQSDCSLLIIYFICPLIIIMVGVFLYYMLKKYLPYTTAIITGGR